MFKNNKTKVLIFSVTYFPFVGGAEVALAEIIARNPDFHFDLITAKLSPELPNLEKNNNLYIHRVGQGNKLDKYLYPLRAFFFARKLHNQNKYNLIWAMLATWAGMAALIFKIFNPKVKYLLTLQSGDSDLFIWARTWFWYPIYRLIYTRADHIQVISTWLKKRARTHGYKKDISLIPNGVDLSKIPQVPNMNLRKDLNIPDRHKIIFTSSRLVKKNDIQTLIQAVEPLTNVTLLIAGSGDLESKLKTLTHQLKLDNKVIFLGHLDHAALFDYYIISDIFIRPSLSEGQGISFIEAMAAKLPIIATPVGGILDFLLDKKTGLFCQPQDPHDLTDKIKLLLADQDLYQEIQTNALKLVQQKYDWQLIAKHMRNIFTTLSA